MSGEVLGNLRSHDVMELVSFAEQPDGSFIPVPRIDACASCGHRRALHYGPGFQGAGFPACMASIDTRHPSAGGDALTPCQCKGWRDV